MNKGWVKISRELLDHRIWTSQEPFCERAAWVDLILLANHKDTQVFGGAETLKRGDVNRSVLSLAERWGWSRGKVRRFLEKLEAEQMVNVQSAKGGPTDRTTNGTTISLVNYGKFQGWRPTDGTTDDTTNGQRTVQRTVQRADTNKNDKNDKECKKNDKEILRSAPARYSFPLKDGTEYGLADEDVAEWEQLYPGLDIAAELRAIKAWCIANPEKRKTRAGAKRFLNGWFARSQRDKKPQEQVTSFMDLWREAQ